MLAAKSKLSQTGWRLILNEGKHHLQMCARVLLTFATIKIGLILRVAEAAQLDINRPSPHFLDVFAFITDSRDVMDQKLLIMTMSVTRMTKKKTNRKEHEKYFQSTAPTQHGTSSSGSCRRSKKRRAGMDFPSRIRPLWRSRVTTIQTQRSDAGTV